MQSRYKSICLRRFNHSKFFLIEVLKMSTPIELLVMFPAKYVESLSQDLAVVVSCHLNAIWEAIKVNVTYHNLLYNLLQIWQQIFLTNL